MTAESQRAYRNRWQSGYTCGDPDCCYGADEHATREEAEAAHAPIRANDRFDVWIISPDGSSWSWIDGAWVPDG